jgi:hypothetical protein
LICMSGKNICILNNEDIPGENQTIGEEVWFWLKYMHPFQKFKHTGELLVIALRRRIVCYFFTRNNTCFFSYMRSCYKRTHNQAICTTLQMQSGNFPLHLRGFIDGPQSPTLQCLHWGRNIVEDSSFLCFQIDQDPYTIRELKPLHFSLHICNSALHHHSKVSVGSGGWLYAFFSWLYISMFKFMHIYCMFNENIEPHFFRKWKRTSHLCVFTHSII